MARIKKPMLARYRMFGHTTQHKFPFHVVGMLEEDQRYVTVGMTQEEAEKLYGELKPYFSEASNETHSV